MLSARIKNVIKEHLGPILILDVQVNILRCSPLSVFEDGVVLLRYIF